MSVTLNNKLRHARNLLQGGDIPGALALCGEILGKAPRNPEALTLRGIAALMKGAPADAARDFRQALVAIPGDGAVLEYLGLALLHLGAFNEAEPFLRRASAISNAPASVWMRLGIAMLRQGRAQEALAPLQHAISMAPNDADCLLSLGQAMSAAGDQAGAEKQFSAVLAAVPGHPDALFNLGVLRLQADDLTRARALFAESLHAAPRNTDAMVNLAIVMEREGAAGDAARMLERALALEPDHPHAHSNLGRLLFAQRRPGEARAHYEAALAVNRALAPALEGLGMVCNAQGRYKEAVHHLQAATRLDPANAMTWAALAENLLQTGDLPAADVAAQKAGALAPEMPWPYSLRAQLRILDGELDAAVALLEEGYEKSGNTPLLGTLAHLCRQLCDWKRWRQAWNLLRPLVIAGEDGGTPFALLSEDLSAQELLDYTQRWAQRRFGPPDNSTQPVPARKAGSRLRIGYFSSDFQEHPAAYLITEVLERHDRNRFEVFAYSYGPQDDGLMRKRIIAAVDHFIDIAWEPDDLAVERIRKDRIDILVDLKGYTVGDRLGIMAQRVSPVQVTWLGYPGTTGTDFIDYLIADPYILPPDGDSGCSERIARMPHCYQPTDRRRVIAEPLTRAEYGLPENAFVFCCFNQTFKITPDIFAAWLRLLNTVPDSVLWLVDANRWATANLRQAASASGIAENRLVFAPRLPLSQHLARYRVADLALDTFPYTSHTTASDALWCGCPLIALCGETFPARVSASILAACGLPDLITGSVAAYEQKIGELAVSPAALSGIKSRVTAARDSAPLFDTAAFTRDLEALFLDMHTATAGVRP